MSMQSHVTALMLAALVSAMPAVAQDAPAKREPDPAAPTPEAPAAPPELPAPGSYTPYFPGILKEGQNIRQAAKEQAAAERAATDKAELEKAIGESVGLALRIGRYAVLLVIALLMAGAAGLALAIVVTAIKVRLEAVREKRQRLDKVG